MTTTNSINSTIPIEISKGGTNATSFTVTNGVNFFDGTRITTAAVGTAGQVLTSNGAAAPTMQTIAGNNLYLIESKTANNSAELEFKTGITSAYNNYLFIFTNVVPATDLISLVCRISTDGGTTYISANYAYGVQSQPYNFAGYTNLNGTTYMTISLNTKNSSSGVYGRVFMYNVTDANKPTCISHFIRKVPPITSIVGIGMNDTTDPVNAFKWYFEAGNITSGRITLYGIKES